MARPGLCNQPPAGQAGLGPAVRRVAWAAACDALRAHGARLALPLGGPGGPAWGLQQGAAHGAWPGHALGEDPFRVASTGVQLLLQSLVVRARRPRALGSSHSGPEGQGGDRQLELGED
jgi:hypothetical protein